MAHILSTIFSSDKREKIILALRDGPKTPRQLRVLVGCPPRALNPHLYALTDGWLIKKTADGTRYELTYGGHLVVDMFGPGIRTLAVIEEHRAFWQSHYLPAIPRDLLVRVNELSGCDLYVSDSEGIHHARAFERVKPDAQFIWGMIVTLHPAYPEQALMLARSGIPIQFIVGPVMLATIEKEYPGHLDKMKAAGAEVWVCDHDPGLSMMVTDTHMDLRLKYCNQDNDVSRDLLGYSPAALKWAEELFEWYRARSRKL